MSVTLKGFAIYRGDHKIYEVDSCELKDVDAEPVEWSASEYSFDCIIDITYFDEQFWLAYSARMYATLFRN